MKHAEMVPYETDVLVVEHDGEDYHLHPCSWDEEGSIQTKAMEISARDPNVAFPIQAIRNLMVEAIMYTLRSEDQPTVAPSIEEARQILKKTGNLTSVVGRTALEQCGAGLFGNADEGDENQVEDPNVPSGSLE